MAVVKKGVIAAAGRGTRFLPVVKGYAKELVPILNKPNIQYLVEEMMGAGITEVAIVHRPGENSIRNYFTQDEEWEVYLEQTGKDGMLDSLKEIWDKVEIHYYPQTFNLPYGNGSPVLAAKKFIDNDPFVYMFGDDFVVENKPGNYLKELIKLYVKYNATVILGCQEVPLEEVVRYGMVKYHKNQVVPNQAVGLVEKPSKEETPSLIAEFGRFVISGEKIIPVLEKKMLGKDNELWLVDAVTVLAKNEIMIAEPMKEGRWMTTGDPLRWLQANIELALKDPGIGEAVRAYLKQTKQS